ncbi:MAG: hypothetical protein M1834_007120 [Cirrosporium novae-zelandiae]|nr:MAG: hypothetical protein M1834_007120 [Cirrosporium novae-zelandiae]
MGSSPPRLGDIPQQSDLKVPTFESLDDLAVSDSSSISSDPSSATENTQNTFPSSTIFEDARSTMDNVASHPYLQSAKDTVTQGPVAESIKNQHLKATSEFQNLANSRVTPAESTATDQPLTHYHSFFRNLLSWKNPRATTIAFLANVTLIIASRYFPIFRWLFKGLYMAFGVTAAAEAFGKFAFNQGLASSFRPRKYYTIPRENLEAMLEDLQELINFFVIEFQRILFVENVSVTIAAFAAAFTSYWLTRILPIWGLALTSLTVMYMGPLIYISNQEIIDAQIEHASSIISNQTQQVKSVAEQRTAKYRENLKNYTHDYTAKAQNYLGGQSRTSRLTSPTKAQAPPAYGSSDFPQAPKGEPASEELKPRVNGAEPIPAM